MDEYSSDCAMDTYTVTGCSGWTYIEQVGTHKEKVNVQVLAMLLLLSHARTMPLILILRYLGTLRVAHAMRYMR